MMLDITPLCQSKSDSDDEDCIVGDLLITPAAGPLIDSRRTSVSAESVDPASLKLRRSQLPVIEKSAEVTESLLKIVSKSPLLRALDAEQRDMIVQAFTGPTTSKSGEKIIQQGESGDTFYLLEEGSVDVFVTKKDEEEKHVHSYKAGDSFGELAIMYNAPRAATCTAQNDCKLWTLDRNSFRLIVVAAAMQKRETYHAFLARVPILQTLTEMEMMAFADALLEEEYQDGEVVCNEGEDGDYFYIIKDGIALCSQIARNKNHNIVATLTTGHYFGGMISYLGCPLNFISQSIFNHSCLSSVIEAILKRKITPKSYRPSNPMNDFFLFSILSLFSPYQKLCF
jgi:cAMP-dependent protein kinase regulator